MINSLSKFNTVYQAVNTFIKSLLQSGKKTIAEQKTPILNQWMRGLFYHKSNGGICPTKRGWRFFAAALDFALILLIVTNGVKPAQRLVSPFISYMQPLHPITQDKNQYEVFGFAPYWTFSKLENVDFNILTTFAYFGVDIDSYGNLDKEGPGYRTFHSREATEVFKKAHEHGTRVILTITQMQNPEIRGLMDDPDAQANAIEQTVSEVKKRGIDGINVDFEYTGDPGPEYRDKFSNFVKNLADRMHGEVPGSKVTVSVYASAVKDPKIYNIAELGQSTDGVFMMAYDFAVAGSDNAIPTAPLYGHKAGKYWYDISTAVEDFLSMMPAEKLILGVPYYGYNYLVYQPEVKAQTRPYYSWRGKPTAQTYSIALDNVNENNQNITDIYEGWDEQGQVGWKAYYVPETDTWRMIFLDDHRSLGVKYDFAKTKKLAGVGMWALGFDEGKHELWSLLAEKFGIKLADSTVTNKTIYETDNF